MLSLAFMHKNNSLFRVLSGRRGGVFSIDSRPISGAGIPARRYRDERGVPVMVRHALLSSGLILDACADVLHTAEHYSAVL